MTTSAEIRADKSKVFKHKLNFLAFIKPPSISISQKKKKVFKTMVSPGVRVKP